MRREDDPPGGGGPITHRSSPFPQKPLVPYVPAPPPPADGSVKSSPFTPKPFVPIEITPLLPPYPTLTPGAVNGAFPDPAGTALPIIYGIRYVEGRIVFWKEIDAHTAKFFVVVCIGPVNSYNNIYINGLQVTGVSPDPNITMTDSRLGTYSQSRSSWLHSLGYDYCYPGVAWLELTIVGGPTGGEPWTQAIPGYVAGSVEPIKVTVQVGGLSTYDPRLGGTPYWSQNAAMAIRDFLTDPVHGCGIDSSLINDDATSPGFSAAANLCDESVGGRGRYEVNAVLGADTDGLSYLNALLFACDGSLVMRKGRYGLLIDKAYNTSLFDFTDKSNCWEVNAQSVNASDGPTRVVIEFYNQDKNLAFDTVTAENPGIATGSVTVREARYQTNVVTNEGQAQRLALRVLKRALLPRWTFKTTFAGVLLGRGDYCTLTTSDGLAANPVLIEDFTRLDTGEYQVSVRQYDSNVYSESALTTDTPPATNLPNPFATPPDVSVTFQGLYGLVTTNTATLVQQSLYPVVFYTIPSNPCAKRLRIRGMSSPSSAIRDAATWASMSASEIVIPMWGNADPADYTHYTAHVSSVFCGTNTFTYSALGGPISQTWTNDYWRVIIKVETTAGILSAGVTLDAASQYQFTDLTSTPPDVEMVWEESLDPVNPAIYWEGPYDYSAFERILGATWSYAAITGSMVSWNGPALSDGDYGTTGIQWSAGGSFRLTLDLGSVPTRYFAKFRFHVGTGYGTNWPRPNYCGLSADGSTWYDAAAFGGVFSLSYSSPWVTGFVYLGNFLWRYMRFVITDPYSVGTTIKEVEYSAATLKPNVGGWVVFIDTTPNTTHVPGNQIYQCLASQVPTRWNQAGVRAALIEQYQTGGGYAGYTRISWPVIVKAFSKSDVTKLSANGYPFYGDIYVIKSKFSYET